MHHKIKKIFTNWRIIVLLICLLLAYFAINPNYDASGVAITFVDKNSSAHNSGISPPTERISPRQLEIITSMQNQKINTLEDYYAVLDEVKDYGLNDTIIITTNKNKNGYFLTPQAIYQTEVTPEIETILTNVTEEVYDVASDTYVNKTVEKNITRNVTIQKIIGTQDIGLRVKKAPNSNIRKGLDLEGGTRVILQPSAKVTDEEFELIIQNMKQRLNIYGLADLVVREARDLTGNKFILVELAGVNQEEVRELIAKQGKFDAKINNQTVFSGGGDIKTVIRSPDQSGIDPRRGCSMVSEEMWICRFYFGIVLSNEAAQRQADLTAQLDVLTVDEQGQVLTRENHYLSQKLDFFLDDRLTDSLNIGADLKGRAVTEIQISGSGSGKTEPEARANALKEMKRMQTILITGSLPVTLDVVKTDSISPILGKEFLNNALWIGLLGLIAVVVIIFIVYRRIEITLPIVITMLSELVLLLGFAAVAGWNLDLAAIAGIIIVIGTSVDHQIIITDETLRKTESQLNWLQKIKRAFTIIVVAGLTTIGAMIPLMVAGAGILKGFALTTMVGVAIGILIARPAYSAMIQILLKN